jgi:hypothetical protein
MALSLFTYGYTAPTLSMTALLTSCKPRILCLHGYCQHGSIFSNKIAGARRKIEREYDLHFLDGPILLPPVGIEIGDNAIDEFGAAEPASLSLLPPRGWWCKSETGDSTLIHEAFEYIARHVEEECVQYDAIIGFSQGGTLATALALSGVLGPKLRAVVTTGAPYNHEVFQIALELQSASPNVVNGFDNVPKLHFAGSTDALVSMESTSELCKVGGSGKLIVHDQGHLFPTRSARVKEILDFLDVTLSRR